MGKAITYKRGIVSFLDILGFRHLLSTKSPAELADVLALFREQGNPKSKLKLPSSMKKWDSMYHYAVLSDCFFRCTHTEHKLNKSFPTGQLFSELMSLVFVQGHMIYKGYLVRGAVTFGEYYGKSDKNGASLFGPAIARAYEIETELANYPRIVVDPALIDEFWKSKWLKSNIHTHQYEWTEYLLRYLRRDDSGVWFVDYLRGSIASMDDAHDYLAFFHVHKELIESNLKALLAKPRPYPDNVTDKYLWLMRYHNATMMSELRETFEFDGEHYERRTFMVEVPDSSIFKEYELLKDEDDD